jgi:hypothetical protein
VPLFRRSVDKLIHENNPTKRFFITTEAVASLLFTFPIARGQAPPEHNAPIVTSKVYKAIVWMDRGAVPGGGTAVSESALLIVAGGRPSFRCHFGEMSPCFRHLEEPRLFVIVRGEMSHLEAINSIAPIPLERFHPRSLPQLPPYRSAASA